MRHNDFQAKVLRPARTYVGLPVQLGLMLGVLVAAPGGVHAGGRKITKTAAKACQRLNVRCFGTSQLPYMSQTNRGLEMVSAGGELVGDAANLIGTAIVVGSALGAAVPVVAGVAPAQLVRIAGSALGKAESAAFGALGRIPSRALPNYSKMALAIRALGVEAEGALAVGVGSSMAGAGPGFGGVGARGGAAISSIDDITGAYLGQGTNGAVWMHRGGAGEIIKTHFGGMDAALAEAKALRWAKDMSERIGLGIVVPQTLRIGTTSGGTVYSIRPCISGEAVDMANPSLAGMVVVLKARMLMADPVRRIYFKANARIAARVAEEAGWTQVRTYLQMLSRDTKGNWLRTPDGGLAWIDGPSPIVPHPQFIGVKNGSWSVVDLAGR